MSRDGRPPRRPRAPGRGRPSGPGALLLGAALVAAGTGAGCQGAAHPARVVLVTVGTLPLEAVTGPEEVPTSMPLLHARAGHGTRFSRFYAAAPLTEPSVASMLTGLDPWEHGVLGGDRTLPRRIATVAEALSRRGVSTAAVVPGTRRWRRLGLLRGFYEVRGGPASLPPEAVTGEALALLADWRAADSALRSRLLWVHYGEPGSSPGGSRNEGLADLDRALDRLLAAVTADAPGVDTRVVVAAAHGTPSRSRRPGRGLDEGEIHAPLLLLSSNTAPGERLDVAGSLDLARTLLSLAGSRYPGPRWMGGRDLSAWAPDPSIDPQATSAVRAGARGLRPARAPRAAPLFYAVDRRGRLFVGTARRLIRLPPDCEPSAADLARLLFRSAARATASLSGG